MPEPTLSQLRAFVTAARRGSLSAAAIELNLTQSALSHSLRALERTLNTALLDRHGRGVTLSLAGQRALPHAEQLLVSLGSLQRAVSPGHGTLGALSGTVRIASFPSLARHLLPGALGRLRRQHPDLTVLVDDAHLRREAVIQAVQDAQAEIGLTQLLPGISLTAHPLGEDPYLLLLPPGWTLPGAWQRPYIHLGDPHDRRVPDALARHGLRVTPHLSLNSETAIAAMVAGGLGFAVLPRMTLPALPPGVTCHPLPWPVTRTYGTVTRPGPLPAATQAVLRELCAAHTGQPGDR
ncbi:LysR family transcriptional regulator [Deinococcus aquaticus]|uniref:LysR family transcriptional regulator n=1 Tax=Deinococcus aquaticus TaxID=328692 RepID=UPI003F488937